MSGDNNARTTIRRINTNKHDAKWEKMYQILLAYKKEHKNTNVSRGYKKDPQLGRWVDKQRIYYRSKTIQEERKRLLNSIEFAWDGKASTAMWEKMYQRLVAFKKEHNDTNVPNKYKEDPQLANWVYTQRAAKINKTMTEERNCLLNSIGFVWDGKARTAMWERMYQRLVAYKIEHKDTRVSRGYKEDPQLGCWVDRQRKAYRNKKMVGRRKYLLNSIDFKWEAKAPGNSTAKREEMYQRLVAYEKEHNNTKVPQSFKKDPKLGQWVDTQRRVYKNKR